jgi:hypothetical protein
VVVANAAGTARTNYSLSFPRNGVWYVHFNSDSTNYSSDFSNIGANSVSATGAGSLVPLTIGPYSVMVFSQTPLNPALTFTFTNNTKIISWPVNYSDWTLQSTTNLNANPSSWTTVPASQYQTNASTISVTVTPANQNFFYRLQEN